ncbi:MAG: hypothetical protein JXR83_02375 [Deltaproteobacteria bacterium]|nr:hypothetical protein [Deltaproteobacteria bacterium]
MKAQPSGTRRAGILSATGLAISVGAAVPLIAVTGITPWPGFDLRVALGALIWLAITAFVLSRVAVQESFHGLWGLDPSTPIGVAGRAATGAFLLGSGVIAAGAAFQVAVGQLVGLIPHLAPARFLETLLVRGLAAAGAALLASAGILGFQGFVAASVGLALAAVVGAVAAIAAHPGVLPRLLAPAFDTDLLLAATPLTCLWGAAALAPVFALPRRRAVAVATLAGGVAAALFTVALAVLHLGGTRPLGAWGALYGALLLAVAALTLHNQMVAGYYVASGLERSFLVPFALVESSRRLGTPYRIVVVQALSAALASLLLEASHGFAIAAALGTAGLALVMAESLVKAARDRQPLAAALAAVSIAGSLLVLSALVAWRPIVTGVALLLGAAAAAAMLLWRTLGRQLPHVSAASAERSASSSPGNAPILNLREALEVAPSYQARVLVATLRVSNALIERSELRAADDKTIFVLYVDELRGLFYPPQVKPSVKAIQVLLDVCSRLDARGYQGIPIWRVAHDPAASIAQAARQLGVDRVIVDVPRRAPLAVVLRGQTLSRLRRLLGSISLEVVRPSERQQTLPPTPV